MVWGRALRFFSKIDTFDPNSCWVWTGGKTKAGYGMFGAGRRGEGNLYAHRYAYWIWKGPIPPGLHIDHLCRNRACVNPDHLEAVTQAVNNRRANAHRDYSRRG